MMFALRVIAILALACSVRGGADLELTYKLLDCCKRAIISGVPAIPIPTHNPLVLDHNISFTAGTSDANIEATLKDIVWYGIPQWELKSAEQLSNDSDKVASFDFDIYWKSFNMSMTFDVEYTLGLIKTGYEGQLVLNWTHTDWKGQINYTKPVTGVEDDHGHVDLSLTWTVTDLDASVTGLGLLDDGAAELVASQLKNYLNNVLGTGLSPILENRLNNFWFASKTNVPTLFAWCDNNKEV